LARYSHGFSLPPGSPAQLRLVTLGIDHLHRPVAVTGRVAGSVLAVRQRLDRMVAIDIGTHPREAGRNEEQER